MIVQPTGSGKSLCFQLPALLLPGLVIVVSPLTAHARDAVTRLPKSVPAGLCLGGDFKRASMVPFPFPSATFSYARGPPPRYDLFADFQSLSRSYTLHCSSCCA